MWMTARKRTDFVASSAHASSTVPSRCGFTSSAVRLLGGWPVGVKNDAPATGFPIAERTDSGALISDHGMNSHRGGFRSG